MDFERIKQNLKFRSGKSGRRSKKRGPDKNDYYEDYRSPSSSNGVYLGVNNKDVAYSDNISALPSLPNDGPNIDNPAFSLTSPNDSNTPAHPHQKSITNPSKARTWSRKHRGDNSKSDGQGGTGASTGEHNFDLRAPMPNVPSITLEKLSELLFSHEHLQRILQEPKLFAKFTAFLNSYRPHNAPVLVRYLETAKALKAIEYANAIAASMKQLDGEQDSYNFPLTAANADAIFQTKNERCFEILLDDALPAFITFQLVKSATEYMIREVTGSQIPMMRGLVNGLTESFCITDPHLPDNPIVLASAEFYRFTGYNKYATIGQNCRFLQGDQKDQPAINRMRRALEAGQEFNETILNYRRNGTPFINCINTAPLLDDRGEVRYYIGAQVEVTGLVEEGRGLESFEHLLVKKSLKARNGHRDFEKADEKLKGNHNTASMEPRPGSSQALSRLRELSELFDIEESGVVQSHSRTNSLTKSSDTPEITIRDRRSDSDRKARRIFLDHSIRSLSSDERPIDGDISNLPSSARPGKLPGVYQSYLLVRPGSPLRIVFTSPSLQHLGKDLLQSPFLSHIAAPESTLSGLKAAFAANSPVTAKVTWKKQIDTNSRSNAQPKWLSATPLLGSDDKVGVWMVIMIDCQEGLQVQETASVHSPIVAEASTDSRPRATSEDSRKASSEAVAHLPPEQNQEPEEATSLPPAEEDQAPKVKKTTATTKPPKVPPGEDLIDMVSRRRKGPAQELPALPNGDKLKSSSRTHKPRKSASVNDLASGLRRHDSAISSSNRSEPSESVTTGAGSEDTRSETLSSSDDDAILGSDVRKATRAKRVNNGQVRRVSLGLTEIGGGKGLSEAIREKVTEVVG